MKIYTFIKLYICFRLVIQYSVCLVTMYYYLYYLVFTNDNIYILKTTNKYFFLHLYYMWTEEA